MTEDTKGGTVDRGSSDSRPLAVAGGARGGLRGQRCERTRQAAGNRDDHGRHAPIANALPLDLGIKKGFFSKQGIEIKKTTLQSGNDIVLALANNNGDIGYLGCVPMMIARTQGIPLHARRGERGRGDVGGRQLAEHPRQGLELDPDARRPGGQDDRRQRAQGRRRGDDQGGAEEGRRRPELDQAARAAVPVDALGAQQRPGRRDLDARAVPDPGAHIDGARIVMAPGPVLGPLLAERRLRGAARLGKHEPGRSPRQFRTAINESLDVRAGAPGRDPRAAPGRRRRERAPADLEPARRPRAAARAREVREGVRRDHARCRTWRSSSRARSRAAWRCRGPSVGDDFILLRLDGKP